jgi:hypothetical protein
VYKHTHTHTHSHTYIHATSVIYLREIGTTITHSEKRNKDAKYLGQFGLLHNKYHKVDDLDHKNYSHNSESWNCKGQGVCILEFLVKDLFLAMSLHGLSLVFAH